MPFVNVKANFKLSNEEILGLKSFLGEAIRAIPGKSESWLMCNIEDEQNLFFKGESEKAIYAEVKIYGAANDSAFSNFTNKLTSYCCNALNVASSRIYVSYFPTSYWGWNGSNF
jgi:phenylpyruvate tautomerase PptA (4-oxalocrotonate tautomerase family)